jgi:exocyst complex component 2
MAAEVIRLYISLISQFFTLSDMAVTTPQAGPPGEHTLAPFIPVTSNSLTTAHYLTKILAEIQECVSETLSMDVSGDTNAGLRSLMESTRWRFEGALTEVWLRGEAGLPSLSDS